MTTKAREALQAVVDCEFDGRLQITETAFEKVVAALKEPLRNCDVGTAEEQAERFEEFCLVHWGTNDTSGANCRHCPLSPFNCKLEWAQMPFEKEETK